jgi:hypothetical protein
VADRWEVNEEIHAVVDKLKLVADPRETTAQEMIHEFWDVIETFPYPKPDNR